MKRSHGPDGQPGAQPPSPTQRRAAHPHADDFPTRADLSTVDPNTLLHLQRLAGNASVAALIERVSPGPAGTEQVARDHPVVQRFLVIGPKTHENMEEKPLAQAGFTAGQIQSIDAGNWMRDMSQLAGPMSTKSGKATFELLSTLARGQLDKDITPEELGGYLPAEHLDRPDPLTGEQEAKPDVSAFSDEQKLWALAEQRPAILKILRKKADASDLPTYIEDGKLHAKFKLVQALQGGPNEAGLREMGDALHTIQDYYSHSNFLDVGLTMFHEEGRLPDHVWRQLMHFWITQQGLHLADIGMSLAHRRGAKAEIMTGTFPKPTHSASTWENIELGLKTSGQLREIFALGWIRKHGFSTIQSAKDTGGAVGGSVGKVYGGVTEAYREATVEGLHVAGVGARAGWKHGRGLVEGIEEAAAGWIYGGVRGVTHGLKTGWKSGSAAGEKVGHRFGKEAGAQAGLVLAEAELGAILQVADGLLNLAKQKEPSAMIDMYAKVKQQKAIAASAPYVPTHAQLAKDDPDHPLIDLASVLAQAATLAVGRAMQKAWKSRHRAKAQAHVLSLVDTYVSHPARNGWWKPELKKGIPDLSKRLTALGLPEMSKAELEYLKLKQQR